MDKRIIFITGSGGGLGLELVIRLARMGHKVYAGSRNVDKLKKFLMRNKYECNNLKVIKLDVAKENSVKNSINSILKQEGKIDILVNNASYGLVGAVENLETNQIRDVLNVNLLGPVRCIKYTLPIMRRYNGGVIVNISSVSGIVASPFLGAYCASKFGLEGLTESLLAELRKYNIRVVLVEPGMFKSNFIKNSKIKNDLKNNPYFYDVKNYLNSIKNLCRTKKVQNDNEVADFIINNVIFAKGKEFRFQTDEWSKKVVGSKLKSNFLILKG